MLQQIGYINIKNFLWLTHLLHVLFIFGWYRTLDHGRLNTQAEQLSYLQLTKHLVKTHKGSLEHLKI